MREDLEGRIVPRAEAEQLVFDTPAPPSRTQDWNQEQAEKGEEPLPFDEEEED